MSSQELEEPWGQLVALEGGDGERVPLIGKEFTVGRHSDVDFVVTGNRCVSSCHCSLIRDEKGEIWLKDTSTNGTLVDGNKVHKSEVKIRDGIVIRIVQHKDHPELNLSYQFFDLRANHKGSEENYSTLEMTVEYEDATDPVLKRKASQKLDEEPKPKKQVMDETKKQDEEDSATVSMNDGMVGEKECTKGAAGNKVETDTEKDLKTSKEKEEEEAPPVPVPPLLEKKDSFEETLICQICQEILHDCISLQPCMHCYCAGCYSDWMEYSKQCPACHNNVERISKNHIVNNLVDAYLRAHPDKKRPEEDIKELDEKNKITKDMLYPKKVHHKRVDSDDEEDYSSSGEDSTTSDYSDDSSGAMCTMTFTPHVTHFSPLAPPLAPPPVQCRQCPSYTGTVSTPTSTPSSSLASFTCTPSTNHILCNCCLLPMPDRRTETDIAVPPQKCDVCSKAFCHMYWGCTNFRCRGCLNHLKDMDFSVAVMDGIISENVYESEILKRYLHDKGLTVKDVLKECLAKLDGGTYVSSDTRTSRISSSTRTCYSCALKNFKDLAYQYREDIPREDLPSDITDRGNCYYGKNCRTQKHNREHCNHT